MNIDNLTATARVAYSNDPAAPGKTSSLFVAQATDFVSFASRKEIYNPFRFTTRRGRRFYFRRADGARYSFVWSGDGPAPKLSRGTPMVITGFPSAASSTARVAYFNGQAAAVRYLDGEDIGNPYPHDTPERAAWDAGWRNEMQKARDEQ